MVQLTAISAILLLSGCQAALRCDYKGYKEPRYRTDDSMEWLNIFADSWYQTNKGELFDMLDTVIQDEVNSALPSWVVSLKLERFGFTPGNLPVVTRVKTEQDMVRCLNEANQLVRLRRVTLDLYVAYRSDRSIVDVSIELPLGVSARLSLDNVALLAQGRLEVLLNTEQPFPGLVSATFSFTERPQFICNVQMYDLIGLDTFGVEKWVSEKIEDLIQDKLVYPGTLFIDLRGLSTGEAVKTHLVSGISEDFSEFPAAYTVNVTITANDVTINEKLFKFSMENLGVDGKQVVELQNEGHHQFNRVLDSLKHTEIEVTLKEVKSFATDPTILSKTFDLVSQLGKDFMNRTVSYQHHEGQDSWNIQIDFWAYLLPAVLIQQEKTEVVQYPSFASEAGCDADDCPDLGVVYVHLHRGEGLTIGDPEESVDPLVKVYLNGTKVYTSNTYHSRTPILDEKFEVPVTSSAAYPNLFTHILKFEVWDHDTFTDNDLIGSSTLQLSHGAQFNKMLVLKQENEGDYGSLYVSVVFKPVPFY